MKKKKIDKAPSGNSGFQDEEIKFKVSEAYKVIRTNIAFSVLKTGCRKIVISSSLEKEGKTTTAVNIAISLAQQVDVKVLLIDADLRQPRVNRFFGINNTPGLSNYLGNMCSLEEAVQSTSNPNLWVMCAGITVPNPSELLASDAMRVFLKSQESHYDYIIIDTSPLNIVVDAIPVIKQSDGVALVVKANTSTHTELSKTLKNLELIDGHVLGIILNGARGDTKDSYSYRY